ncbi:MAG: crossover junction endodeoxyribonuclease RuvC [bacterium]|nr:crossover junction endodeoxyribonuclease RuvC [bacterium]
MRVIGIDPGTRKMGYGIVESSGSRLIHIDNGAIFTSPEDPLSTRLKGIYDGISDVIEKYSPDVVSIEDIFYSKNVKSAMKLGHARGVGMLAGANKGLHIFEYTPTAIKSAVVGFGRAEKKQVQQMVKVLLNLPEVPQEDAADALAAAICHINTAGTTRSQTLLRSANR